MAWHASKKVSIQEPALEDVAYLAGLIDGEGCFFAYPRGATGIQIGMTVRAPLEWAHQHFSGNLRTFIHKESQYKDNHTWALQRQADLQYLIPRLLPLLKVKQNEAQALLDYLEFIQTSRPQPRAETTERQNYYDRRAQLCMAIKEART